MSRAVNLAMSEKDVVDHCSSSAISISAIETLVDGGTRLVCSSSDGADAIRRKLKSKLIKGDVRRQAFRPSRPLW